MNDLLQQLGEIRSPSGRILGYRVLCGKPRKGREHVDYFNALEDRLTRRRWKTGFRAIPWIVDGRPGIGDGIPRRIGIDEYFAKHPEKCVPFAYIRCKSLNPLIIDEEAEDADGL